MGLLDASYSAVNTKKPRKSDRILPATELNARGLLDAATNVPIAGDALSGVLAAYDAAKGDYGSAAMNALGVLPFLSAGMVKPTEKLFHGSLGKLDGELRKGTGTLGEGFYLTNKEKQAALYPKLHAMKQGIKNPDVVVTPMETTARNIYNFDEVGLPVGGVDSRKLQELGYDGATYNNELIVFDPSKVNQVKQSRPMTEYEKRHEIARQNAVKMLGLPENNTAMDRARAMGAERVYHGSRSPEGVVKDGLIPGGANGASRSGDAYGVGVYTTTSPSEASSAVYTGENGAVFPLMIMRDNHLNIDNPSRGELEKLTNFAQDSLLPSDKARFSIGRDVREFDSVDDARPFFENQKANWKQFGDGMERAKPEVISNEGGKFKIEFTNFDAPISINNGDEANTLLKAVGYDSVPSMGFSGHTMNRQSGNTWDVTNDTSKLRSVFAAFDPAKRYSNDLMGYADPRLLGLIGGGGLLGLGAYKANQE